MKIMKFILILFLLPGCFKKNNTLPANIKEEIIIPVRVLKYDFVFAPDLSSAFSPSRTEHYFNEVNLIWKQAVIKFTVSSFDTIRITDSIFLAHNYTGFTNKQFREILETLSENHIRTRTMSNQGLWTIVLIGKFPHPAGGVWSNRTEIVFFAETNNGISTAENIWAHELGHSLSLTHVNANQFPDNLMKQGDGNPQTAVKLTQNQINRARQHALRYLNAR